MVRDYGVLKQNRPRRTFLVLTTLPWATPRKAKNPKAWRRRRRSTAPSILRDLSKARKALNPPTTIVGNPATLSAVFAVLVDTNVKLHLHLDGSLCKPHWVDLHVHSSCFNPCVEKAFWDHRCCDMPALLSAFFRPVFLPSQSEEHLQAHERKGHRRLLHVGRRSQKSQCALKGKHITLHETKRPCFAVPKHEVFQVTFLTLL